MNLSKFFLLELFNESFVMSGLHSLLIANRGEIAVRIMHTAHLMGIHCAVIYTIGEENSLFVRQADHAFCLGEGSFAETYLNIPLIIDFAVRNNIEAIHPGYGFLSENPDFAKACEDAGIIFVGPASSHIRMMSDKMEARNYVAALGIPLLQSIQFDFEKSSDDDVLRLPFPLIIKAAAGGGGKGMHVVRNPAELIIGIARAQREAKSYFDDERVYFEQYLESPRHIEVQILGDKYGHIIHLYDRECTIQRRHQKIIEEAPSAFLSTETRNKILKAALEIANSMAYTSAGTIEFLLDGDSQFYFLEMNTRIQVEHPVTEAITGVDIVREQLHIANGDPLLLQQSDIAIHGHGLECRIYAEDAFNHFQPSAGLIRFYQQPEEQFARVDTSMDRPIMVMPDFDPMISKVIVKGENRVEARTKMKTALQKYVIHGIHTNINYLNEVLDHPGYIKNTLSTSFCKIASPNLTDTFEKKLHSFSIEVVTAIFLIAIFSVPVMGAIEMGSPAWQSLGYWRNFMNTEIEVFGKKQKIRFSKPSKDTFKVWLNDQDLYSFSGHMQGHYVDLIYENQQYRALASSDGINCFITYAGLTFQVKRSDSVFLKPVHLNGHKALNEIQAPLSGKILKINVQLMEKVEKGTVIMIVESMKMENHIVANFAGIVDEIYVKQGDKVKGLDVLAIITST